MNKQIFLCFCGILLLHNTSKAQLSSIEMRHLDSLKQQAALIPDPWKKVQLYCEISDSYQTKKVDSSSFYAEKALLLVEVALPDSTYSILKRFDGIVERLYAAGELAKSMEFAYRLEREYISHGDSALLPGLYNSMGNNLKRQGAWRQAMDYYIFNLNIAPKFNDYPVLAYAHMNLGECHIQTGQPSAALTHLKESLRLMDEIDLNYKSVVHGKLGEAYLSLGKIVKAESEFRTSVTLLRKERWGQRETPGILNDFAKFFIRTNKLDSAIYWSRMGLGFARSIPVILEQEKSLGILVEAFNLSGQKDSSLIYLQELIQVKDEIKERAQLIDARNLMARMEARTDSIQDEAEKRELELLYRVEVERERSERNILLGIGVVVLILAVGLWSRLRFVRRSRKLILEERDTSNRLLLNILPEEVAAELKAKGAAEAKLIEETTVLFSDIKGFTKLSELLTPNELVEDLNQCFSIFDQIMEKFGVEKIKTIGDAYMAAGGIPTPEKDSVKNTVLAAIEMQDSLNKLTTERESRGFPAFEMRIGIHTGPVVAGIVGIKKFQYDIWGDTVNTASRMESAGEAGRVNISHKTYEYIKDDPALHFEKRGKIEVKGKGEMEMYYVTPKA